MPYYPCLPYFSASWWQKLLVLSQYLFSHYYFIIETPIFSYPHGCPELKIYFPRLLCSSMGSLTMLPMGYKHKCGIWLPEGKWPQKEKDACFFILIYSYCLEFRYVGWTSISHLTMKRKLHPVCCYLGFLQVKQILNNTYWCHG